MRLAIETVVAIAQMSDGSFWSERQNVVVTTAACLEELRVAVARIDVPKTARRGESSISAR